MENSSLGRTALFELHRASGARIVPFAGWEMPVQYAGLRPEALAVRASCGLFDVGHMGQLDVRGEGATEALNRVVSADWSKVPVGRAGYALLLGESGGVLDDVMGYHLSPNHWLVVANASRAAIDEAFLKRHLPPAVEVANRYANQAMIAIQGPRAQEILGRFCDADLAGFAFRDARLVQVLGEGALVARGGYTGCDGFEWMGRAQTAPLLWQKLIEAGAIACGLGARDVLRLESGLPLYGHELSEDLSPDESGVAFAVKAEKGPFPGRDALLARRAAAQSLPGGQGEARGGSGRVVRGLRMEGRAIAREGYSVRSKGEEIGVVTSGTLSPALDEGIALALLPRGLAVGEVVEVVIRGVSHPGRVAALPFVPRSTRAAAPALAPGAASEAASPEEKL